MQKPTITVIEINKKYDSLLGAIEQIQTTLQQELTDGPATAQAARLVAFALSQQAYSMLVTIGPSVQCLQTPSTTSAIENGNPRENPVSIAEDVLEAMMEQFGAQEEAIAPFVYEAIALLLPVIETLVENANDKLSQAEELTQQVRSLAW
jgi:hypothetical protein